jgi:cation/acetate symporter
MLLGIFWAGTTRAGAVSGMLAGLGICVFYMVANAPSVRVLFGLSREPWLWFGILPLSAGVFGVAVGALVTVVVSFAGRARR